MNHCYYHCTVNKVFRKFNFWYTVLLFVQITPLHQTHFMPLISLYNQWTLISLYNPKPLVFWFFFQGVWKERSGMQRVSACLKQKICQKQETKHVTFKYYNPILFRYEQVVLKIDGLLNLILLLCRPLHIFEWSRHSRFFLKKENEIL